MLLPTGKSHVSFSEVKMWKECPWRHKLVHIDKLSIQEPSPHLDYGTIIHEGIESFLKTKKMDIDAVLERIFEAWQAHGFDTKEFVEKQTKSSESQGWKYKHNSLQEWKNSARNSLERLPIFMNENFGNWKTIEAEHQLYEDIVGLSGEKFKGFIDAIILSEKDGKKKVWIIDWKTSSERGWNRQKRQDFLIQAQLMLYKSFWAEKMSLRSRDVSCGFVLLKKNTPCEKSVQLVPVSVGPKPMERSQKLVRSAIKGIKAGIKLKNREACRFCEFKNTKHCT
tara:strand:- start:645 stop:1487 length:843 start_codon:yes stop_codon:yes gene_type:complete